MNRISASCAAVVLLTMYAVSGALAQAQSREQQDPSAESVPYLTGGVGESSREEIAAAAKDYSLKLVFAESSGAFVADVQVVIKGGGGATVLEATSNGPLFFAKLPAGNYTVVATFQGVAKQSAVSVAATGQSVLDFRW
jgi:hypothetical protein